MTWRDTAFDLRKFVLAMTIVAFLTVAAIAQKDSGFNAWHTYSPNGAPFSIRVPAVPLPAQGHIFDPTDNSKSFRIIEEGLRSTTYNFEINKKGRRQFLVSILAVEVAKNRSHKFVTDSEVETIDSIIGDDIEHSNVVRRATKTGEASQWSYNKKGSLQADQEDDGVVHLERSGTSIVIVVVDYDYARPGDPEIKAMLRSLRIP